MKSTNEYLQLLRQYMDSHGGKYGIVRMGIFGSVARGEQTEKSLSSCSNNKHDFQFLQQQDKNKTTYN